MTWLSTLILLCSHIVVVAKHERMLTLSGSVLCTHSLGQYISAGRERFKCPRDRI